MSTLSAPLFFLFDRRVVTAGNERDLFSSPKSPLESRSLPSLPFLPPPVRGEKTSQMSDFFSSLSEERKGPSARPSTPIFRWEGKPRKISRAQEGRGERPFSSLPGGKQSNLGERGEWKEEKEEKVPPPAAVLEDKVSLCPRLTATLPPSYFSP